MDQHAAARIHTVTKSTDHVIGTVLADAGYNSDANLTTDGPDRLIALGKGRDQARVAAAEPVYGPPPADARPNENFLYSVKATRSARRAPAPAAGMRLAPVPPPPRATGSYARYANRWDRRASRAGRLPGWWCAAYRRRSLTVKGASRHSVIGFADP